MKGSLGLIALLIAATASAGPPSNPFETELRPLPAGFTMSNAEVAMHATPYFPHVARCYEQHARRATGALSVYVVIARDGKVVYSEITAPGVTPLRRLQLERCLRDELATWRFPARKGFTNAVIPYVFGEKAAPIGIRRS